MAGKEVLAPKPALEISTVTEELYTRTREALAKEGFTFVVAVKPVSIVQLATDEPTKKRFNYVHAGGNMRAIVPPQMEVIIDPRNLRIENSNNLSTDDQIRMIEKEEATLKGKLPQEVRNFISMRMQSASVLAQVDSQYQEETGNELFTNWFGRTDDQTRLGGVANVGRSDPTYKLIVFGFDRDYGYSNVFAVPMVVLPRKSDA